MGKEILKILKFKKKKKKKIRRMTLSNTFYKTF